MKKNTGIIRPYEGWFSLIFRLVDVALALLVLFWITQLKGLHWNEHYRFIALLAVVFFTLFASYFDIYRSWRIARVYDEITQLWSAWALTCVSVIIIAFLDDSIEEYSRPAIISWFITTAFVFALWRFLIRRALYTLRKRGRNSRSVAIAGATRLGRDLSLRIRHADWMGLRFCGFYDDRTSSDHDRMLVDEAHIIGNTDELIRRAQSNQIDIVYITYPFKAEARTGELIKRLSDTTSSIYVVPDFSVFNILHSRWTQIDEFPLISIHETPHGGIDGWVKRLMDLAIASFALLLLALPMLIIALVIKLTSRGPVLFKQTRYGVDGHTIKVWKFRSMTVMENDSDIKQATRDDPRVTPLGSFLRRSSLDELPQFINVLIGDMSVVGPRPHAVAHNEQYRKLIDGYMLRHKVKPGITGLAQVKGFRGETETLDKMKGRIEYDLEYIRNWSIFLDLKLILLTIINGFRGQRAY